MQKEIVIDNLRVVICENRRELGETAAADAAEYLRTLAKEREEINTIFAAAPSQNEFLAALAASEDIPWQKIRAFHMDEYIGLAPDAPQRFARYLKEHIFSLVPFMEVNYLICEKEHAIEDYAAKLCQYPADACFMGVGENGHIAFNDPPVADLFDPCVAKPVSLDDKCRMQQVHDGCFDRFEAVPEQAVTLTVPTLLRSKRLFCMVPGKTKAEAVRSMLYGPVDMSCPASALRLHKNAALYLDADSAAYLECL